MSVPPLHSYVRRHLLFGWWSLLVFLTLGIALEAMHGFKLGWYLDVDHETRRLMFRLAHAHGALLGLVHLGLAFTFSVRDPDVGRAPWVASSCLIAASFLLPGGFLLGGVVIHAGDPGAGIVLAPIGAVLLFAAVLATTRLLREPDSTREQAEVPVGPRQRKGSRGRKA